MKTIAIRPRAGLLWLALTLSAGSALADVSDQDQAAARALFDQGRALAEAKKHAQACPKFEESQRLDPGTGTLFHLADCYEKTGKTASAWSMFLRVASQSAAQKRPEREAAARARADALKPALSNLVIRVVGNPDLPGLEIKRDGTLVGKPMWGSGVPVDPGKHAVTASAPGHATWSGSIDVPSQPGNTELAVPALSKSAEPAAAQAETPGAPNPTSAGSGRRLAGLVVGGAGVVALGVGTVLALGAKSKFNDTASLCNGNLCTEEGASMRHDAVRSGNIATIVGAVGIAAMATGAVLYLTAPSAQPASAAGQGRFRTVLAVGPGSVALGGTW
jgi:hypothetical protein